MSTPAVIMMVVSMVLVWGGLVASILFMRARPQVATEDPDLVPADDVSRRARRGRRGSRPDR
ncbi:methionine/alanine import family NSS transporter small subunit [Ornithinimicrobium sufpigmenti]|uniref:methionine/alanine import family NSS transporter small subunit n=1 Tax=Ornithinimicrobium sufpigmenti TaxID=2508882 RepID=UPI0010363BF9|nr:MULTISPECIES: methionine/alanine import family NSS transporter small subunit [unclassified Ornithinimicrobium]